MKSRPWIRRALVAVVAVALTLPLAGCCIIDGSGSTGPEIMESGEDPRIDAPGLYEVRRSTGTQGTKLVAVIWRSEQPMGQLIYNRILYPPVETDTVMKVSDFGPGPGGMCALPQAQEIPSARRWHADWAFGFDPIQDPPTLMNKAPCGAQ